MISYNRPARRNAIDDELGREWQRRGRRRSEDDTVRCLLLCGEGRSFCSGRDTRSSGNALAESATSNSSRRAQEIRVAMLESPKPVVAAVQGYALGGGFETTLGADMRIAADDAVFAFPRWTTGSSPTPAARSCSRRSSGRRRRNTS